MLIGNTTHRRGGFKNIVPNGSGIAEGRDLKDKSFSLAQILNRITNDC
jgi:hypothetical protein